MANYIGAIDQGTTSTRFIVFDRSGRIVTTAQKEHEQIYPKPGWVEHNPEEIWQRTQEVIDEALKAKNLTAKDLAARRHHQSARDHRGVEPQDRQAGLQRHRLAGHPHRRLRRRIFPTGGQDQFRRKTGLPLATYFSGLKIRWILENVPGVRALAEKGECLFGNIDTYLIWKLTGGTDGGIHVTDVTNASRTQLMNLETLDLEHRDHQGLRNSAGHAAQDLLQQRSLWHGKGNQPSRAFPSPATSAISRRLWWARLASSPGRPRTPTAPAASCC